MCEHSKVTAIYIDGTPVQRARAGDDVVIVLDHTPFYAESGGQAGDTGELRNARSRVIVEDTIKVQASVFGHHGRIVEGEVEIGDNFVARVDAERRAKTVRNHSSTHLMHKALREVLGGHVQQKGSLVNAERTRFDFAHNAPMTEAQIAQVEALVNAEILANAATQARVMPIDEAQKVGAMMLFGEKYGDEVRVLDIGSSRELCGGTHVQRTGDIGLFKVVAETGVAAGVRRVEAVTGDNALAYLQGLEGTVNQLAGALKSAPAELPARLAQVLDQVRTLEKELAAAKGKLASSQGDELLAQAIDVNGLKVLAARLDGADAKALARDARQAEGQAQVRGHRARHGRGRQGPARGRRHGRPHGQDQGRRTRQLRRSAGRRQGRRQGGHGDGRRHRAGQTGRGAGLGEGLGRRTRLRARRSEARVLPWPPQAGPHPKEPALQRPPTGPSRGIVRRTRRTRWLSISRTPSSGARPARERGSAA